MDYGQNQLNQYQPTTINTTPITMTSFNYYGYAVILGIVIILFVALRILRRLVVNNALIHHVVYLIKLPKDRPEDQAKEFTVQQMREEIAKAEGIFTAIGGFKAQHGLKRWFFGRTDHYSFEIVAYNKLISFYIAVPRQHADYIQEQIQANYPEAVIEEVLDYNMFNSAGNIAAATIKTKLSYVLPIKTYLKEDTDPLNSLINVMSKIGPDEGLAIQYIVRSAAHDWHKTSRRVVKKANENYSLDEGLSSNGFSKGLLKFMGEAGDSIKGPKNQPEQQKGFKRLSPKEEEAVKGIEEKNSKAGLEVNIRLISSAPTKEQANANLWHLGGSFSRYNYYEYGNSFNQVTQRRYKKMIKEFFYHKKNVQDFIYRRFYQRVSSLLNTEEMASLYHFPLKNAETPNILWLTARQSAAPVNLPTEGLLLGTNVYRGVTKEVYMKSADRLRHTYIIGKSGTGKSVLLANMAIQDVIEGRGVCMIDPHGDLIQDVLEHTPPERADDVVIFSPADIERPMSINLLEYDPRYPEQKTFVINEMIGIFDKLYDLKSTGGPIFEQYMRNAMLLVMSDPASGSTLMEIPKVLSDPTFRNLKLSRCADPTVVDFWRKEAEKAGGDAALANVVPYITSKLTSFISNDMMRPIIGQQTSSFNLRDIMDEGKILLINLPKGIVGEMNAYLLGMIIVGKILMAALSRADANAKDRKDFYLYIDEFQNFTTDSVTQILSEARKYGLGLIIAHQYIGQLSKHNDTTIKDAVFGNVGTMINFKIGSEDAEFLKKEFAPVFNEYDLINIEKYTAYVKLLIDNTTSRPFSMKTPWPLYGEKREDMPGKLKNLSRLKYGQDRAKVEAEILQRTKIAPVAPKIKE
jgi:hypothetical protein